MYDASHGGEEQGRDPQRVSHDEQPGNTVAFADQANPQLTRPRSEQMPQTEDDHGKQAALDSLLAVNYDEQHPVDDASADRAPTQIIPSTRQAANPAIGASPLADQTRRITDPNVQRKIRRDQRPDAGGTQVFKKH